MQILSTISVCHFFFLSFFFADNCLHGLMWHTPAKINRLYLHISEYKLLPIACKNAEFLLYSPLFSYKWVTKTEPATSQVLHCFACWSWDHMTIRMISNISSFPHPHKSGKTPFSNLSGSGKCSQKDWHWLKILFYWTKQGKVFVLKCVHITVDKDYKVKINIQDDM